MSVSTQTVNNALVYYDSTYTHRWYEAFGPSVVKYLQEFVSMPVDDGTGDPIEWELNITETGAGNSTAVLTDAAGGALLITTDDLENDGWQMQLGGATGECVKFDGDYATYFGCSVQVSDATQSDLLLGVCVDDTDCLGGVTDGMYFRKVDGSTSCSFVLEKGSSEDATAVLTMANATDYFLEFYYDGVEVHAYVDGTLQVSKSRTDAQFPNDEEMRLTVEFLTGADAAKTCTLKWLRLIHLRG